MLTVRLLGGLDLEYDGRPLTAPRSAAARGLLAWLALHPGPHPRPELAARFWPDVLDQSARQSLRTALWTLRRDLGPVASVLRSGPDAIELAGDVSVDARALDAALDRGDTEEAARLAAGGELLRGVEEEWALREREERTERLGRALAASAAGAEDPADAVAWARRRWRLDPLSEEAARDLMERLAQAGDRASAVVVYERLAERLRRELRVAPSATTRALIAELRAEPAPEGSPGSEGDGGAVAQPARALLPRPEPLIGRGAELASLLGDWQAARAGAGGVVVLQGEPGIGKTRLVAELAHRALTQGCEAALGVCLDLDGAPPLAPWAELLESLQDGSDAPPPRPELGLLVPHLSGGVAAPRDGDLDRARLHEAVVLALADAARRGPVLLLLEDVHLADAGSLALLARAGRRLRTLAGLLVVTRRPALAGDLDAALASLETAGALRTRLTLTPLREGDAKDLVRTVAAGLPDAQVRRAVKAADGNPLLAVETARAIAAGHAGPPPSLTLAVHGLLRGLSPAAREVVDLLAVAGRPLDLAELEVLPVPDATLHACAGLACGLLAGDERRLGFRHALLRDAAYAAIEPPRRRSLHLRVAEATIAAGRARPAEVARHLRRGGRDDRAVEHLARAARAARDVVALPEARAYVREALDLRPDDPPAWMLLAHIEALSGRHEAMFAASEEALKRLPGRRERGLALGERAVWLSSALCWPAEALVDLREAMRLLDGVPGVEEQLAHVLAAAAWAEAAAGDPDLVDGLLSRANAMAPADPFGLFAVHVISARVNALVRQDRPREALALADELAEVTARPDSVHRLGETVWLELGAVAAYTGEFERALECTDRYLDVSGGLPTKRIEGLAARAYLLLRLERGAEALSVAEAMAALAEELGETELPTVARGDLGHVLCEVGEHERGVELLARTLEDERTRQSRARTRLRLVESLVALGRTEEARRELRAAVLEPQRPADQPEALVPRVARLQGLIAAAEGDAARAAAHLVEAAGGWRRLSGMDQRDAFMSNIVDLGRPPVAGLTEPARELARVEREHEELQGAEVR